MYEINGDNLIIPISDFANYKLNDIVELMCAVKRKDLDGLAVPEGGKVSEVIERDLTVVISDRLKALGIKKHHSGYNYLRTAISMCVSDPTNLSKIIALYFTVSRKYVDATSSRVERAMRHAIESSGCNLTNSEFIANVVDEIRLELNMVTV